MSCNENSPRRSKQLLTRRRYEGIAESAQWRQSLRSSIDEADGETKQRRQSAQISDAVIAHYTEQLKGQVADLRSSSPCQATMARACDPPPCSPLRPETSHHSSSMPAVPALHPLSSPYCPPPCQLPSPSASSTHTIATHVQVSSLAAPLADAPVNEHFSTDLNPFSQTRPACEIIQSSEEDGNGGEV